MLLNLTQLRQDYKATRKSNWTLAEKINILIEVTKIEMKFRGTVSQAAKRIGCTRCLTHRPVCKMVGQVGFEPTTARL